MGPNGSKASFSGFKNVEMGPPDAIFLVKQKYNADTSEDRLDVGIGAYRDENGKPYVLNVVKKVEKMVVEDKAANKEYLGIKGDPTFIKGTKEFLFGTDSAAIKEDRVATVQALSGTGALRLGAELLRLHSPCVVYVPAPTWGNHHQIFKNANLEVRTYNYFFPETKGLDFDGMMKDLKNAPTGSCVLLHVCSHNPTGVDPTMDQWKAILELVKSKKMLPFFDSAYQGFASGDTVKDAAAVRLFEEAGIELMVAQSYSKNMGLYGERIGALNVLCDSVDTKAKVLSQLERIIRAMYSNPPRHGAAIAGRILTDEALCNEWKAELKTMTDRIAAMRTGLREEIEKLNTPGDWSFITQQIGMFTFTGLSAAQVKVMMEKYHVYMPSTGRISVAGLTAPRLPYLAKAINDVVVNESNL